ncbi:MAG: GAF domain-containing protein [Rubripirellula sp.]
MSIQATEASVVDQLYELSSIIVNGATLEESLESIFESFQDLLPYDRIGFAEIDSEAQFARARWARSTDRVLLRTGYTAPLKGSSLSIVIDRRQPRILNDLPAYLDRRPDSRSTSLIVREGIKSSMTCPLFVQNKPLGILFFSSRECSTYNESHVLVMKEITMHLAMLLMASQHTPPVQLGPVREANREDEPRELLLSQLKPGMVIADQVRIGNRTLLLAAGTTLTQQLIDRLIAIRQQGLIEATAVMVY